MINQRIARLPAPAGRALGVAAAAGATFSFVLLEHALAEESGVLDALDQAIAAGLLTEAGDGDYVFAHALVRQTIYDQLSTARRKRLHRQLGETLEALGDADAHVEMLAYHFAQAAPDGQSAKAADYALAAGGRAIARLGYEDAAMHYERGLQALQVSEETQNEPRCELLLALGQAYWGTGELDKARQAYQEAARLADELGDATALAHAALGFCGPHRFEVGPRVIQPVTGLLRRALASLGADDSPVRAQLMGRLAAALAATHVDRRPTLALRGLEMARRVGDKATLADVLASSLWAIRDPDSLPESVALTREFAQIAYEVRDDRLRAFAHWWLLDHLFELGNIDEIECELEALQRLTDTRPERAFKWVLAVVRASHAYLSGRIEHETLAYDALAHRFIGDDEVAIHTFAVQMFFVRLEQGRLDELVQTVESMAEKYPQLVIWRCARASANARLDRGTQARQDFEVLARADFCDLPRDAFWLPSLSALASIRR